MEYALAWLEDERAKCTGCGHYRADTFDRDNFNRWDPEPYVCHACQARDQAARAWSHNKNDTDGVYWSLRDREEMRRA